MIDPRAARLSRRRWLTGVALIVVLAALTGQAQGPAVPSLLGPAEAGARVPAVVGSRLDTLEARPVTVRAGALAADILEIELTSGRVVRAQLDRRESHRNGAQSWSGHVPGEPLSTVTLVLDGGVLQGSVRLLDGAYSIEPAGSSALSSIGVNRIATARKAGQATCPESR